MKTIIRNDILTGLHYLLKINSIKFSGEEICNADIKILEYIENNITIDEDKYRIVHHGGAVFLSDENMQDVFLRYVAILQDNVSLLEKLTLAGYKFHKGNNYYNLFVFDKRLSSKFKEDKYVKLLMQYNDVFKRFYNSLRFIEEDDVDSVIDDFVDIIKKSPRILRLHSDANNALFTGQNIKIYGKEFLINSNNNQRRVINSIVHSLSDSEMSKLKEILDEFPYFEPKIKITPKVLDMFDIIELVGMSDKDAHLYQVAFSRGLEDRLYEILKLDPEFNCTDQFMQEELFRVLDNETIIALTDDGKKEIAGIRIPRVHNAIVMPVKKINKLVEKDKKRLDKKNKVKIHMSKLVVFGSHK